MNKGLFVGIPMDSKPIQFNKRIESSKNWLEMGTIGRGMSSQNKLETIKTMNENSLTIDPEEDYKENK